MDDQDRGATTSRMPDPPIRPDDLLRHILESLPYPFLVIRADNYAVLAANRAAQWSPEKAPRTCYALSHGRDTPCPAPEEQCPLEMVKQTGQPAHVEHTHRDADGNTRVVEVYAYPVLDDQGNVIEIIEYCIDVTERRQAQDALRQLSQAVEQSPSTVAITDLAGNIEYVNSKFTELTGYTADEVLGRNVHLLSAGLLPAEVYAALWRTLREGNEWRGEFHNRRRDGTIYWEQASISAIRDASGRPTHYVKVAEDITARREAEEALQQRTIELQARNEELDAFAHTVAHDLKNPLAAVSGYAELLEGYAAELSAGQRQEYLQAISQNVRKINNIIKELLLLASVRREDVELLLLDMAWIVGEARGRLRDMLAEHQAELIVPEEWPQALGYGPWIEEVWVNYLSNAIKYGGRPPRIDLGADRQPDGMIRFWVHDNGAGIPAEDQPRLFAPFTRLDRIRVEGQGLGLSIVQSIVEKLGGQVGVKSTPGEGSTFYFTLPAAEASQDQ